MVNGRDIGAFAVQSAHRRSGGDYVPVPRSSITCGFDEALSMIEIVPCFAPFCVGEKVALIVQVPAGATLVLQVEVRLNSGLAFIEAILSALAPAFVRVTVCGGLVVPMACFLKFSGVVGEKLTTPVLSRGIMLPPTESRTKRSGFPSRLKSPAAIYWPPSPVPTG